MPVGCGLAVAVFLAQNIVCRFVARQCAASGALFRSLGDQRLNSWEQDLASGLVENRQFVDPHAAWLQPTVRSLFSASNVVQCIFRLEYAEPANNYVLYCQTWPSKPMQASALEM